MERQEFVETAAQDELSGRPVVLDVPSDARDVEQDIMHARNVRVRRQRRRTGRRKGTSGVSNARRQTLEEPDARGQAQRHVRHCEPPTAQALTVLTPGHVGPPER